MVGEMRLAAALARAGHNVAKPYWNDDEIDLLVLFSKGNQLIPIPVQVKSIQRDANNPKGQQATQGLNKKYLQRQYALCLGIYCPQTDKMWFIHGAERIKAVHAKGVAESKGNRTKYDDISDDKDVPIYVDLSDQGNPSFDSEWLVDPHYPDTIDKKLFQLRDEILQTNHLAAVIQAAGILTTPTAGG